MTYGFLISILIISANEILFIWLDDINIEPIVTIHTVIHDDKPMTNDDVVSI